MPINSINNFISRYQLEQLTENERLELAQQVLDKIKATNALPNPIHFMVIYESITKIDKKIGQQIEDIIENGAFNDDVANDAFRDLILKYLFTHLPSLQVEELLQNLIKQMDLWFEQTSQNQQSIQDGFDSITEEELPVKIKETIEKKVLPAISDILTTTDDFKEEALETSKEIHELKTQLAQANAIAKTDELTKLPNRRAYNEALSSMLTRAQQEDYAFSLVIVDIDHFKKINDEYGHIIGDSVLRYLANLFKKETKGKDFVGRLGGEEFVLLLPYTRYENALLVAENLRDKVAKTTLKVKTQGKELKLNISLGIATYQSTDNDETLLDRADKALYLAKDNGRNQVKGERDL